MSRQHWYVILGFTIIFLVATDFFVYARFIRDNDFFNNLKDQYEKIYIGKPLYWVPLWFMLAADSSCQPIACHPTINRVECGDPKKIVLYGCQTDIELPGDVCPFYYCRVVLGQCTPVVNKQIWNFCQSCATKCWNERAYGGSNCVDDCISSQKF